MKTTTEKVTVCVVSKVFVYLAPYIFQNSPLFSLTPFQRQGHPLSPRKLPTVTHVLHLIAAHKMTSQRYYFA